MYIRGVMKRFYNRAKREDKGAAIVEYAILLPLFFLLIFGIIEMATIFWIESTLEQAVQKVARFTRTGDTVTGQTRLATAKGLIDQFTFDTGLIKTDEVVLTVKPYPSLSAIPDDFPTDGTVSFGNPGQPVVYTLSYKWTLFAGNIANAMGFSDGTITLQVSEIVINEPGGTP